jgi:hypothetical protein
MDPGECRLARPSSACAAGCSNNAHLTRDDPRRNRRRELSSRRRFRSSALQGRARALHQHLDVRIGTGAGRQVRDAGEAVLRRDDGVFLADGSAAHGLDAAVGPAQVVELLVPARVPSVEGIRGSGPFSAPDAPASRDATRRVSVPSVADVAAYIISTEEACPSLASLGAVRTRTVAVDRASHTVAPKGVIVFSGLHGPSYTLIPSSRGERLHRQLVRVQPHLLHVDPFLDVNHRHGAISPPMHQHCVRIDSSRSPNSATRLTGAAPRFLVTNSHPRLGASFGAPAAPTSRNTTWLRGRHNVAVVAGCSIPAQEWKVASLGAVRTRTVAVERAARTVAPEGVEVFPGLHGPSHTAIPCIRGERLHRQLVRIQPHLLHVEPFSM